MRIGFIKSLTHVVVTPLLHRNTIRFIGMNDLKDYAAYKVLKDKFIALDHKGLLTTWNLATGKLICTNKVEGNNYSDYEVHYIYRQDCVLIKSKKALTDSIENDFYKPW